LPGAAHESLRYPRVPNETSQNDAKLGGGIERKKERKKEKNSGL